MAPSLADGVPGIEGLWFFDPPSPWPELALNDWMDASTGLTVPFTTRSSFTRLQKITGLYDKPDSDDPRVNLVNRIGEEAFPRQQRGKTLTFSGIAYGATLSDMRAKIAAIRACSATESSDPTDWLLYATYDPTYDTTGMAFTAYGQPIGFTSDEVQGSADQVPTPYQRAFDFSVRLHEPRFWFTNPTTVISGSPITVGDPTPIADGTAGAVVMTGTAPSEPVFTIYGSGSGSATIVLTNAELISQTGHGTWTIVLPAKLASGDTLVVDFTKRTAVQTHSGVANDVTGYVVWPSTDWWGEAASSTTMLIGTNTLKATGDSWSCSAIPAVW